MGQILSDESPPPSPPQPPPAAAEQNSQHPTPSMNSLIAEAVAYGDDENESMEAKAQKALNCPCIADLRNGACGDQFSAAFLCFLKSIAEEKGSDCVNPFVALQNCIKENPNAFSKEISEEEEPKKEEALAEEYKIIPPVWSKEPRSPKANL